MIRRLAAAARGGLSLFGALSVCLLTFGVPSVGAMSRGPHTQLTCGTSWVGPVSGSWNDSSLWSAGVPTGTSDACITVAGTYTVTIANGAASARTLTLGGASGTQTLLVQAGGSGSSISLNGDSSIGANGVLTVQTSDTNAASISDSQTYTLSNAGTLGLGGSGGGAGGSGSISLSATVTNAGTTSVTSAHVQFGAAHSTTFRNQGNVTVAGGGNIRFDSRAAVFNDSGSITNNGLMHVAGTYTQGDGTLAGNPPTVGGSGGGHTITYAGGGSGTIDAVQSGTVSGDIAAGQTLVIAAGIVQGVSYGSATWSTGPMSNAGTITLETSNTSAAHLNSSLTTDTLTNSGTLNLGGTSLGAGTIGLAMPITNTGTTSVTSPAVYFGAGNCAPCTFTNQSSFSVALGGNIDFSFAGGWDNALVNDAGSITNNGLIRVDSSYTQGDGTLAGNPPIVTRVLTYTGTGSGTVDAAGNGACDTLSGNIAAGQTLVIAAGTVQGIDFGSAAWCTGTMSNAGTLTLQTSDASTVTLQESSDTDTLTNSGTLNLGGTSPGAGTIHLQTQIVSSGTTNVTSADTRLDYRSGTFRNEGGFNVSAGGSISFSTIGLVNVAGSVANSGTIRVTAGYTQRDGTLTGNPPIVSGQLTYAGTGSGTVDAVAGGTLSGDIVAGQTLVIAAGTVQGVNFGISNWNTGAMTNAGTITLQTDTSDWAQLNCHGAVLTNNGTLQVLDGGGTGQLYVLCGILNNETLLLGPGAQLNDNAGSEPITQGTSGVVVFEVSGPASYGSIHTVNPVNLGGTLHVTALGGFKPAAGTSFPFLSAGTVNNAFAHYEGLLIDEPTGLYYRPVYTATTVTLTATAELVTGPATGMAGSQITVIGTGFIAGDTITVTFTDGSTVATATGIADASGDVSIPLTIPADAASGSATLTAEGELSLVTSPPFNLTVSGTPNFTLDVTKSGTGSGTVTSSPAGINCGSTCSYAFPSGTTVTLTAASAVGSVFSGWSGACSGTGSCVVTMNSATSVTASFSLVPETLTVSRSGTGAGSVTSTPAGISCGATCSHQFAYGASVTLTATPASGSTFTGWSGACSGTGSCVVTMRSSTSVTASFTHKVKPPKPCLVPKLKGENLKAATSALKAHNCSLGQVTHSFSSKVKKGRVISQKPAPGKRLKHGAKVSLVVSKGKR